MEGHRGYGRDIGLIVHLSASTALSPDPDNKVMVTSVEKALQMGGCSFCPRECGSKKEPQMLNILGEIAEICDDWGATHHDVPRGDKITDEHSSEVVKIAARVGSELGADIIKTNYTRIQRLSRKL